MLPRKMLARVIAVWVRRWDGKFRALIRQTQKFRFFVKVINKKYRLPLIWQSVRSAIASNGSVLVHDTEIALVGFTSEDVDASLNKGDFGAARETGEILNAAAKNACEDNIGLGEAMGREVSSFNPTNAKVSLLCTSYKQKIPFTAHLVIGE